MPEQAIVRGGRPDPYAHKFASGYRDGWNQKEPNPREDGPNYERGYAAGVRDRQAGTKRSYMWR